MNPGFLGWFEAAQRRPREWVLMLKERKSRSRVENRRAVKEIHDVVETVRG